MLRLLNKTRFRNCSVTFSECSFIPGIWVEISFFHFTGKCKTFSPAKDNGCCYILPRLCGVKDCKVRTICWMFVRLTHTRSNILWRFHILFVDQIHFPPPLSSRYRCKTMQVVTSIHREIYLNKSRIFLHFSKQLVTCFLYCFKDSWNFGEIKFLWNVHVSWYFIILLNYWKQRFIHKTWAECKFFINHSFMSRVNHS